MLRSLSISVFSILLSTCSFGQYYAKPFFYKPTGALGATFKSTVGIEIGNVTIDDEDIIDFDMYGSFVLLSPRQEVFHSYSTMETGSYTEVRATEEVYQNYPLLNLGFRVNISPLYDKVVAPYVGLGALFNFSLYRYKSTGGFINTNESTAAGGAGLTGVIGIRYRLSDALVLFTSATRNVWISSAPLGGFGANEYGLGLIYMY